MSRRVRDPKRTRRMVLEAGYREFYRYGFQGGSLNRIVDTAGITKGALFHHFSSKNELGYAVVEEFLVPAVNSWWIQPLAETRDPIPAIQDILRRFRKHVEQETPETGFVFNGCPVCNYAAEMSPLDEGFRERLAQLYGAWRQAIAAALRRGQKAGTVRGDANPNDDAAFLVAGLAGMAATGKVSQRVALFQGCLRVADRYVESMRPSCPERQVQRSYRSGP